MFADFCKRSAPAVTLALILVAPASAVQAKSPSVAQIACMARDLPSIRGSNLPGARLCALRGASPHPFRGRNNSAHVQQDGTNNRAEIRHRGSGHSVNLVQEGSNNSQVIFQFGHGTQADIHQTGGQSGVLIQLGW